MQLNSYTDLTGPVGGLFSNGVPNLHPILQTARISLADFTDADLTKVRGVRLVFDDTPTGAIYVANIRLSARTRLAAESFAARASPASVPAASSPGLANRETITGGNTIRIRGVAPPSALGDRDSRPSACQQPARLRPQTDLSPSLFRIFLLALGAVHE